MQQHKEVLAFETKDGKEPFTKWFNSLKSNTTKAKIMVRLDRVRNGNYGFYRRLASYLFELKEKSAGGIRVYCGQKENKIVILLLGGNKSSQKEDIKKASKYWKEYKMRGKND